MSKSLSIDNKPASYIPDRKDLAILKCICDDARLPYSAIGKKIRVSKDRVRERMKRLEKELFILSYMPLIDYSKLGYKLFHVYARFNTSLDLGGLFIRTLRDNVHVVALTRLAGAWDMEIQILGRSRAHLLSILKDVGLYRSFVSNRMILEARDVSLFSMRVELFQTNIIVHAPSIPSRINLDTLDFSILSLLSVNAREKIIEIASSCGTSEDVIRYRIKRLLEMKVIRGFYARTNKHRFGLTSYILELSVERLSLEDAQKLELFQNVYYIRSFKGNRNLLIGFSARDNKELVKTIDYVKDCFGKRLGNFELSLLLDRYKFLSLSASLLPA